MTRRNLFERTAGLLVAYKATALPAESDASPSAAAILARIKPPSFPSRDWDVTRYGALADGKTNSTNAIQKAIAACSAGGGGRVVIPKGNFFTGAIHLDNNVNLHLAEGASLLFSTDPKDYPMVFTRYEGTECMNYSPLIYAFGKTNIAVTGYGILDGQASHENWWSWVRRFTGGAKRGEPSFHSDRDTLVRMGNQRTPVKDRIFGQGHYLRPNFIQPYRCKNVLLEGFTMRNSPMWELNPVLCENVTVRNVNINSHGPNNDGCDPESSRDVLITGCIFSTGDDCIAIKSGRNEDGRRVNVPCENVIVQDCRMKDGHGGVSIGSEVSGGIKNVYISRCQMSSPNLQRGLRIKTNSYRGGSIENIHFEHVTIGQVAEAAVEVDFYYEEGEGGPFRPTVKDIYVAGVSSQKSKYAIYLRGYTTDPIVGVTLADCSFADVAKGNFLQNVKSVSVRNVTVNGRPFTTADFTKRTQSEPGG